MPRTSAANVSCTTVCLVLSMILRRWRLRVCNSCLLDGIHLHDASLYSSYALPLMCTLGLCFARVAGFYCSVSAAQHKLFWCESSSLAVELVKPPERQAVPTHARVCADDCGDSGIAAVLSSSSMYCVERIHQFYCVVITALLLWIRSDFYTSPAV